MSERPPAWAVALLRVLLPPHDREAVLGGLLDEYRISVRPARGYVRASGWYVGQIAGYIWRDNQTIGLVLIAAWAVSGFLPRLVAPQLAGATSLRDAATLVPAAVLTPPALVMMAAGARASWRAHSAWAGLVVGFLVSLSFAVALLIAYVVGIGLSQPQLLRFALTPESVHAMALMLASTTGTGTAVSAVGGIAAAVARRVAPRAGTGG